MNLKRGFLYTFSVSFVLAVGFYFYDIKEYFVEEDKEITSAANYQLGKSMKFTEVDAYETLSYLKHGWSGVERSQRWTEGKQSRVLLKLESSPQSPLILSLFAAPFTSLEEKYRDVKVSVNGYEIADWQMNSLSKYQAVIPKDIVGNGLLDIRFNIANPAAPCDVGNSNDCRKLGFFAKELVIDEEKRII